MLNIYLMTDLPAANMRRDDVNTLKTYMLEDRPHV